MTPYVEEFSTIADSLAKGDLGLLVGAGLSAESQIDLASAMAKRLLKRAVLGPHKEDAIHDGLDAIATKYPFEAVAELAARKLAYFDFNQWLLEEGGLGNASVSQAHEKLRELRELLPYQFPKAIFTTNFDTLVETALTDHHAHTITSRNLNDMPKARRERKTAVIHLHGAVNYPESIEVGERTLWNSEGPVFDLVRGALSTDVFVLLGYSLTDGNLKRTFLDIQRIATTRRGLAKRTFAVSPAAGDRADSSSEAAIAAEIWKQRGVDHIAISAGEFLSRLVEVTRDHVQGKILMEVAHALGHDNVETLQSILASAVKPFKTLTTFDLLLYLYYALTPLQKRQ